MVCYMDDTEPFSPDGHRQGDEPLDAKALVPFGKAWDLDVGVVGQHRPAGPEHLCRRRCDLGAPDHCCCDHIGGCAEGAGKNLKDITIVEYRHTCRSAVDQHSQSCSDTPQQLLDRLGSQRELGENTSTGQDHSLLNGQGALDDSGPCQPRQRP